MAASISLKQFTQNLIDSGLMTDDELSEFRAKLPSQLRHLTPETLARELVRAGHLTTYQVGRIYENKHHGLILGNNVIVEKIGAGGMGEVFLAKHRRMKRPVVIKVLHEEHTKSEQLLRRFQREVEAAAQLNHPHIVTAFDADEQDGIHFLVMEYVEGRDLSAIAGRDGPLEVGRAIRYIMQAAEGLDYAHEMGIVHRDIKPSNLLVDTKDTVKVLDMGLARFDASFAATDDRTEAESLTQANQIVGTVDYMSPEQSDSAVPTDRRADIYSLGCTLYRLLSGQCPYPRDSTINKLIAHRADPIPSIREIRSDVPEDLDAIIQRTLAKNPDDRFATMRELIQSLQSCLAALCAEDDETEFSMSTPGGGGGTSPEITEVAQVGEDTKSTSQLSGSSPIPQADVAVGIDLGTTYSVVAYLDSAGRPQAIVNAEGDKITPSAVLFEQAGVVVGKEAIKAMDSDMALIAECAKRDLGHQFFHKQLTGEPYPPEALEAWILNKLRQDAWARLGQFRKVVITVPAYFDEVRRKATQDAGYMAGFEVMDIINEPTAAAIAFGYEQGFLAAGGESAEMQNILVYDLGGGTFDVTVMEIGAGGFRTLSTDGDVRLGGRDWDQRLVDYVTEEFIRAQGVDPRDDVNSLGRMLRECEEAKRSLSARQRTTIVCKHDGMTHRVKVSREDFEGMTQDLLDRTSFTVEQTVRAAGLQWEDIDRVLLVGGSTRMPAVVEMLKRVTGKDPDYSVSPDEAVAHGAALHASWLLEQRAGRSPKFSVKNVNSHSLGVVGVDRETGRKKVAKVIARNTTLPTTAKRIFTTSKDGQQSILIRIVEGESASPDACVQIGQCVVRDLPSDLPAHTPVEVRFKYETNGRLTVRVRVSGNQASLQHEITRENSLSQEDLNHWRKRVSGLPPIDEDSSDDGCRTEVMQFDP